MSRQFLILSILSIGFAWTAKANELISSSTFTDTNQKSSLDSLSFLQDRVSAQFITRYLQDSNIFLRENETEADIINASVQLGIKGGGLPTDPGLSYRALYGGNYFSSLTDEFEYASPADHNFLSGVELRGAFTKLGSTPTSKNMVDMLDLNLLMGVFHHLSENQETWVIKRKN